MPVYLFYEKKSGKILHLHREVLAKTGETVELDPDQLLREFRNLLPPKADAAILVLAQEPERARGFRYSVDVRTKRLIRTAKPRTEKEKK